MTNERALARMEEWYGGTFPDRFWVKVNKAGPDDCWEWQAGRAGRGYGVIMVRDHARPKCKRSVYAHRSSWEYHHGKPIPDGLLVLHECDNPGCVNPAHLFVGTQLDNVRDMHRKGRASNGSPIGEKNGHARLTSDDVRCIRRRFQQGESKVSIAAEYSINKSHVWRIVSGVSWSHIR